MKNPNGASWVDRYVLKNGMCAEGEILRLRLCLREAMTVGTSFGALHHLSALWGRLCGQHVWEERSGADTLVGDGVLDVPAVAPSVSFADSSPGEGARRRAIRESPLRLGGALPLRGMTGVPGIQIQPFFRGSSSRVGQGERFFRLFEWNVVKKTFFAGQMRSFLIQ